MGRASPSDARLRGCVTSRVDIGLWLCYKLAACPISKSLYSSALDSMIAFLLRSIRNSASMFLLVTACGMLHAQEFTLPPLEQYDGAGQYGDSGEVLPSPSDTIPSVSEVVPYQSANDVIDDTSSHWSIFPDVMGWNEPSGWFLPSVWERSLEVGINGSEGNAQAFSLVASTRLKRETDRSVMKTEIVYGRSEANSVLTQHYGFWDSRWDFKLGDSRWSYFNLFRLEFDEFKAFDYRLTLSSGLGYDIIKTDARKLTGRFGAGVSREFGGGDERYIPEAVFGMDYEHQLTKRQKLVATADYFPSWDDFGDYRIVANASWELLLDEETNLSLKIGAIDRYDSTPFGREPNDIDYFVTLLWKL